MREPTSKKLIEVAEKYAVPGIKLRYKRLKQAVMRKGWLLPRDNHLVPAHADLQDKECLLPFPDTREKLYVNLHERGHLLLGHFGRYWTRSPFLKKRYTRAREKHEHQYEYEAEMFAHKKMRENGIQVPRKMTLNAKLYIQSCIASDQKRGIKINPKIMRWAFSRAA